MRKTFKPFLALALFAILVLSSCFGHSHNFVLVEETKASCTQDGVIAHYECECGKYFDLDHNEITNIVSPKLGHNLTHHAAKDATCTESGNVEYWHCERCGKNFSDQAGTKEITNVVVAAKGHNYELIATWDNSGDCTYYLQCKNNNAHKVENLEGVITHTDDNATCTSKGSVVYTLTVTYDGKTYTSNYTLETAMKEHDWRWVIDVEPTETTDGVKHEVCNNCGEVRNEGTVIPHTHTHELTPVNGQAATETEAGFKSYYSCECGKYFEDAQGEVEIPDLAAWKAEGGRGYLAPTGAAPHQHSFTTVAKVDATETTAGHEAYYVCSSCGKAYTSQDDESTLIEDLTAWLAEGGAGYIAPVPHQHDLALVPMSPATETTAGYKAYYTCSCGKYFEDAQGEVEISDLAAWKAEGGRGYIAPTGVAPHQHELTLVQGKEATTTEAGYKAYYECSCGKYFEDEAATVEIADLAAWKSEGGAGYLPVVVVPHTHEYTKVEAKAASCTEDGNIEYYTCNVEGCGKLFTKSGEEYTEVTAADVVIPAGHKLDHVEAKEATCTEAGNIEYWVCSVCGKYFEDEDATVEIAAADVVIPAGHEFVISYRFDEQTGKTYQVKECENCDETSEVEYTPLDPSVLTLESGVVATVAKFVSKASNGNITVKDITGDSTATFILHATTNITEYNWLTADDMLLVWGEVSQYDGKLQFNKGTILYALAREIQVTFDAEQIEVTGLPQVVRAHTTLVFDVTAKDESKKIGAVKVNDFVVKKTTSGDNAGKYVIENIDSNIVITATFTEKCVELKSGFEEISTLKAGKILITTTKKDTTYYLAAPSSNKVDKVAYAFTDLANESKALPWIVTIENDAYYFSVVVNGATYYLGITSDNNGLQLSTDKAAWTLETKANGFALKNNNRYLGIYNKQDWRTYTSSDAANYKKETVDEAQASYKDRISSAELLRFYEYFDNVEVPSHTLDKTDAVEATCTTPGCDAYWTCSVCHKHFTDEEGKQLIADFDAWLAEQHAAHPALGHNYEGTTVKYEWSADNKTCTATISCQRSGCTYIETEISTSSYVKTADATCTTKEKGTFTATFENSLFETQTKENVEVGEALGHSYGETPDEYVSDGGVWYAVKHCANGCGVDSKEVTTAVKAGIGSKGFTTLAAAINSEVAGDVYLVGDAANSEAITLEKDRTIIGFNYNGVLSFDGHKLTLTGTTDGVSIKVSKDVEDSTIRASIVAVGKEINIAVEGDYKVVTLQLAGIATISKKNSEHHVNYQTLDEAIAAFDATTDSAIILNDNITVKSNDELTSVTISKSIVLDFNTHTIKATELFIADGVVFTVYNGKFEGTISYVLLSDQDTRLDVADGYHAHIENPTEVLDNTNPYGINGIFDIHEIDLVVIAAKDSTCTEVGNTAGTKCQVCGEVLSGNAEVAAKGHDLEATFTWTNKDSVSVTLTCKREECSYTHTYDANNKEDGESLEITSTVTKEPTCTEVGKRQYKATYIYDGKTYTSNYETLEDIDALGHEYGAVQYTWNDETHACTASHTCTRQGCSHEEVIETVTGVYTVVSAATCEANEKYKYVATFTVDGLVAQETADATKENSALNHGVGSAVSDRLTAALINSSSYGNWSNVIVENGSGAKYSGNSSGGTTYIQIRAKDSSGIVSTTSGGTIIRISVVWNSDTANGRTLDVYGKNTAYAESADLYSPSKQGTKIGSIVCGTDTELVVVGEYTFIGLRSKDGAMYLDSIVIEYSSSSLVAHAEEPATCTETGHKAYWTCSECGLSYKDEAATQLIGDADALTAWLASEGKIEKHSHHGEELTDPMTLTPAVSATCTTDGHKAYYLCFECGLYYADENGNTLIGNDTALATWLADTTENGGKINKLGHNMSHVDGQAETCTVDGWKDYYHCDRCDKYFEDINGETEITDLDAWKIGAGKIDHHHTYSEDVADYELVGGVWKELHACTVCNQSTDGHFDYRNTTMVAKIGTTGYATLQEAIDSVSPDASEVVTIVVFNDIEEDALNVNKFVKFTTARSSITLTSLQITINNNVTFDNIVVNSEVLVDSSNADARLTFAQNMSFADVTIKLVDGTSLLDGDNKLIVSIVLPQGMKLQYANENKEATITNAAEAMIGETHYNTLADALAAAQTNDVIKLIVDVAEETLTISASVTLDINHKVLMVETLNVTNDVTLSVLNGTLDADAYSITEGKTLTLGAGKYSTITGATVAADCHDHEYNDYFDVHLNTNLQVVAKVDATCTSTGTKAYFECSVCGDCFENADATTKITDINAWKVITVQAHAMIPTAQANPNEANAGHKAYWTCSKCNLHYSDEEGNTLIGDDGALTTWLAGVGARYSVHFDVNGGNAYGESVDLVVESPFKAAKPATDPTTSVQQESVTLLFMGWYTKDGSNDDWGIEFDFDNNVITANTTLYAKWDLPAKGTVAARPYTVAEAIVACSSTNSDDKTNVYTEGIICKIDSYNSGAITYWISDDGNTTTKLEVYKGKGTNGDSFDSKDDISLGDYVIVFGNLTKYNSTNEYAAGSEMIVYTANTITSLSITGVKTSFVKGDTFSLGNDVNITGTFAVAGEQPLTADDLTFKIGDEVITTSTELNTNGNYTITVLYTGTEISTSYDITVAYADIETFTLTNNSKTIGTEKSFDLNTLVPTVTPANANPGFDITIDTVNTTATGYTFIDGVFTSGTTTGDVVFILTSKGNNTKTITYTITVSTDSVMYTVSFDLNYTDAPAFNPEGYTNLESGVTISKPTDPTRTGYALVGWYKEIECTTAWTFASDTVTEDITLYAKWNKNPIEFTFNSSNNSKGVQDYTISWQVTSDSNHLDISNFNNNNNGWNLIKCGRKNNASVGTLTTHEAISTPVKSVVVKVDAFTSGKVNSFKLYISSDSTFDSSDTIVSLTIKTGDNTFEIPQSVQGENLYYKIEIDCASGSSNGLVTVSKVTFNF